MLVDVHVHLYYWEDKDVGPLLDKARRAGVGAMVTLGITPRTCHRTLQQARAMPMVYAGIGIHPRWVKGEPRADVLEAVRAMALAREKKVRFIGETGLDFEENAENFDHQKEVYRQMIRVAKEVDLPLNCHSSSHKEQQAILRQEGSPPRGGVIHGFHGGLEEMKGYLDLGMSISVGLRALRMTPDYEVVVKTVPLDRLLLETDATGYPSHLGIPTEPAQLAQVASAVAELRGMRLKALEEKALENLERMAGPFSEG